MCAKRGCALPVVYSAAALGGQVSSIICSAVPSGGCVAGSPVVTVVYSLVRAITMGASSSRLATSPSTLRVCVVNYVTARQRNVVWG